MANPAVAVVATEDPGAQEVPGGEKRAEAAAEAAKVAVAWAEGAAAVWVVV